MGSAGDVRNRYLIHPLQVALNKGFNADFELLFLYLAVDQIPARAGFRLRLPRKEGAVPRSLRDQRQSEFNPERFLAIPFGPNATTIFGRDVGPIDDFLVVVAFVHRGISSTGR